ncbi:phospholipase DDHD2-like isoform X4 [Varroa destructor]|uniref:DDHD domain-containing protein n=1 Tax=Varroa destructor TaxID=109461 RepID=A0A7M7KG52_VARDE|nr:phospholipase DDHD2-like isoform X4 [Varroa destructor]
MEEIRQILTNEFGVSSSGNGSAPSSLGEPGRSFPETGTTSATRPTSLPFEPPNRAPSPLPPPLKPHWFYMRQTATGSNSASAATGIEGTSTSGGASSSGSLERSMSINNNNWTPFSLLDSNELENAHIAGSGIVTVCGGRFEVDLSSKKMYPVYWTEPEAIHVRRCTWFYKGEGESRYTPYEEDTAHLLEESFQKCHNLNKWNRQIDVGSGHYVKIYSATLMTHHVPSGFTDEWGNISDSTPRPRIVKRGADQATEAAFEPGEGQTIDHLIFVVHGIGAVCDLKMRTVEQCLDDFRSMSNQLIQNHFGEQFQTGKVGRVEFLPVSWHSKLHGETTGLDEKLQKITINTISRVREFSNDTILDALLYTSPVYCQTIVDHVGSELNRLHHLFKKRNPNFTGTIGLAGHSLGSMILYDILSHQQLSRSSVASAKSASNLSPFAVTPSTLEELFDQLAIDRRHVSRLSDAEVDIQALAFMNESDLLKLGLPLGSVRKIINAVERFPRKVLSRKQSYTRAEFLVQGNEGTGQLTVNYPQLEFAPDCFFAMGSPIAMFIVVRGNETLGKDFRLPTCPRYFNIYHPYDPIAYRMEPLIDPSVTLEPAQIPHHKGRKRMHLEVKESLKKVSTEVKQKFVDAVSALSSSLHRRDSVSTEQQPSNNSRGVQGSAIEGTSNSTESAVDGWALNQGRRVDHVLQEGPLESFNEYLSVLFSHACYWESEDTLLLMVKEHYALKGIYPTVAPKPAASSIIPFYPLSPTSPSQVEETSINKDRKDESGQGVTQTGGLFWTSITSVASISNYFSLRPDSTDPTVAPQAKQNSSCVTEALVCNQRLPTQESQRDTDNEMCIIRFDIY